MFNLFEIEIYLRENHSEDGIFVPWFWENGGFVCLWPDPSCSKSEEVDVLGHLANQTRKTPE